MRIGSVRRNSQVLQRLYGFETVESFGHENYVRMQVRNQLQAWINSAPNLGFFSRVGGVIAEFGIADEMILQPKRVDGLRQTWRERHDTGDRLGNANRAAGFGGDVLIDWDRGRFTRPSPLPLPAKLKFECKPRPRECQCATENGTNQKGEIEETLRSFSGFSNWACVFPLVRAGLPANLRGDRVHSRKCSSNA